MCYPVNWLKFIFSMQSQTGMTEPSTPRPIPIHVAYSPLASMNHHWTINLHDLSPPHPYALIPGESIQTSIPILCNHWYGMFNSGVDYTHITRETNPDPPSLDPPKGEMANSFHLTHLSNAPHLELYVWMNQIYTCKCDPKTDLLTACTMFPTFTQT